MTQADSEEVEGPTVPGFWAWLVKRDEFGDRGVDNVANKWLLFHLAVAGFFAFVLKADSGEIARIVAVPGAAILVGLAFGWAGRSASLLQDKTFSKFLIENGPPVEGYVYAFQLAVLAVLAFIVVALVLIAGGLGFSFGSDDVNAYANRMLLFSFGSIAVRESWGIIDFVNKLTIQYYRVREQEIGTEE